MSVVSLVLLLAALPAQTRPAAPVSAVSSVDDDALKLAHIAETGPALLDFLHKRSGAAVDKAVVNGLIKQLADPSAAVHDAAAGQLTALGESAVPALREAVNKLDDPDFAARARQCLLNIDDPQAADLSIAVVRAAAQLRPDGVVDALLEYLPFAENDKVAAEVQAALVAVVPHDGKPPAALLRALTDPAPVRRAAAAVALCRSAARANTPPFARCSKIPSPPCASARLSPWPMLTVRRPCR